MAKKNWLKKTGSRKLDTGYRYFIIKVMDKNHNELIEYLDKKFEETAKKEAVDDLTDDVSSVKEAVTDLTDRVISIEEKVEDLATKKDVDNLRNSVDNYAKKADTYYQEFTALTSKVDRHEKWIEQIAEKMGVELKP